MFLLLVALFSPEFVAVLGHNQTSIAVPLSALQEPTSFEESVHIPPYNDTIVPKKDFDINTAGRVQRIVARYFPRRNPFIRTSILVRDTIGLGLSEDKLRDTLREVLKRAAEVEKVSEQQLAGLLDDFDREFGARQE